MSQYPPQGGPPGGQYPPGQGGYGPPPGPQPPGGYPPPGPYPYKPVPMSPHGRPLSEWWKRLVAALIDGAIVGIPAVFLILVIALGAFSSVECTTTADGTVENCEGIGGAIATFLLSYLIVLLLQLAYQVVMNGGQRGQTVGKMVMKIQVRDEATGGPIGYGKAALRVLVTMALGLACGVGQWLDGLWPLWDQKRQTLHDKAANTLVVDV